MEGRERRLHQDVELGHRLGFIAPREMDAQGVTVVCPAKPQGFRSYRPHFTDVQVRSNALTQAAHRLQSSRSIGKGHKVLRLNLITVTGREVQAEVRQALNPRPRLT